MSLAFGGSYDEPGWHDHIPQERADLYYNTIKDLLGVKDTDLKSTSALGTDKELLELLKARLEKDNI